MKAFLSHSTKGQQFVDTFAAQLKAEKIERGIIFDYSFSYVHDQTSNARPNNDLRVDGYSLRLGADLIRVSPWGSRCEGNSRDIKNRAVTVLWISPSTIRTLSPKAKLI
jgi:hypothetical protein